MPGWKPFPWKSSAALLRLQVVWPEDVRGLMTRLMCTGAAEIRIRPCTTAEAAGMASSGAVLASAVAGSRRSLGCVSSQIVLCMWMLFAVGCQADGNLHYRLSSWAVGVKIKLSLYSSTLMRNVSPGCFGTGGVLCLLWIWSLLQGKKNKQKTEASGPYCSSKFLPPTSPTLRLFWSVGKAWQQLENYPVCATVMVEVHSLFPRAQDGLGS